MRYCLNTTPPFPLLEHLQTLEKRWQGNSASLPHLTLMSSRVLVSEGSVDDLMRRLLIITQDILVFPVRLLGVGSFNERKNIHICIEQTEAVSECHRKLVEATRDIFSPTAKNFVNLKHPHITIADHLPIDRRVEAWNALSEEHFQETFLCEYIHLMRREEHDASWSLVLSFPLQQILT